MPAPAQVSPEVNLRLSQAPTKSLSGVVLQILPSEMTLHHCVAALDTGFVLTYILARICSEFMEVVVGTNPPRSCSDMAMGMGDVAEDPLLPSAPDGMGRHPAWPALTLALPEERPFCKQDTNPTCMSQWEHGALCRDGTGDSHHPGPPAELLATANAQTLQHNVSALPGVILLASQSFKLLSNFYLPAMSSVRGAGSWAAPCLLYRSKHGEQSALPGDAHC